MSRPLGHQACALSCHAGISSDGPQGWLGPQQGGARRVSRDLQYSDRVADVTAYSMFILRALNSGLSLELRPQHATLFLNK